MQTFVCDHDLSDIDLKAKLLILVDLNLIITHLLGKKKYCCFFFTLSYSHHHTQSGDRIVIALQWVT
jgi:hypothetical protein